MAGRAGHLQNVRVCKLICAAADAVQHEGHVLVVLLEDDFEDAILLWEAGRHVVEDICQLHHKFMRGVQDLPLQGRIGHLLHPTNRKNAQKQEAYAH